MRARKLASVVRRFRRALGLGDRDLSVALVRELDVEGDPAQLMLHTDPHSMSAVILIQHGLTDDEAERTCWHELVHLRLEDYRTF